MKEQTLIEMKNKIETLGELYQEMTYEFNRLKDLSIGTLELVKKFSEYDKALEDLKEESLANKKLRTEAKKEAMDKVLKMCPEDEEIELKIDELNVIEDKTINYVE